MNSPRLGLRVASVLAACIGMLHLLRLLTDIRLAIGSHELDLWPSAVAAIVAGGLCWWFWRLAALLSQPPSSS